MSAKKTKRRPQPELRIPAAAWEPAGPDDDKTARLMATVVIGGCFFHAEAFAVKVYDDEGAGAKNVQGPVSDEFVSQFAHLFAGSEADGHFETVSIGKPARDYVIFLYPFC